MLNKKLIGRILLVGVVFAVLYWVVEALLMTYVFHENTFMRDLFYPNTHELWMRSTASLLILSLAIYAQYVIRRHRLTITRLEESLSKVKTLSGLLPICAWCKKLRDDEGYWKSVEEYISSRTGAEFTHGMCPECQNKYFSEYSTEEDSKANSNSTTS